MAERRLPDYFTIPQAQDYDDVVSQLDMDIQEEGGPRSFLGMIRTGRRSSQHFCYNVLSPLTQIAMFMSDDQAVEYGNRTASATLAGAVFGHIINEAVYPGINQALGVYGTSEKYVAINSNMLGGAKEKYTSKDTTVAQRLKIGYSAMAARMFSSMDTQTIQTIDHWSKDVVAEPYQEPYFVFGVGFALYAGWDRYTDRMIEDGRGEEVILVHDHVDEPTLPDDVSE
jgi:hypothetical protein